MRNIMMLAVFAALTFAGASRAADSAKPAAGMKMPGSFKEGVLTDKKGMTLYTFDKDEGGKSACAGPCAKNWPPYKAGKNAKAQGDWTMISRDDKSMQWAYMGKPVYTWNMDKKPGDKTGDGFKDTWHVVKEGGSAAPATK